MSARPSPLRSPTATVARLIGRSAICQVRKFCFPSFSSQTTLEEHLRALGVTTLLVCGCDFPRGPRATIYAASNRDFRIVLVTDAVSGTSEVGLRELSQMGIYLMTAEQSLGWLARDGQRAA